MSNITEKEIRQLAEDHYGNDIYLYAKQRDGYVMGYKAALQNKVSDPATEQSTANWQKVGEKDKFMDENERKDNAVHDWISVDDRPLFTKDKKGNWICTDDGDKEFFAAVPYTDKNKPNKDLWWIRHCVIEDETGLCVVGDDVNEPAGWQLENVTHWMPLPAPPESQPQQKEV
jgi:hypothetical protein